MATPYYTVPLFNRFMRAVLRPIFRGIFYLISEVRISGLENVPGGGAYLIAANHVSTYEPPFILAFWPTCPEAAGAVEIWSRPGQNWLARLYHGIPVHRGEYDRQLLEKLISVLKSGRPLLIAPEGGRSHTPGMRRALPGAAYIAEHSGVPILPVGISGATDDFLKLGLRGKRPIIEMNIGQPFWLPATKSSGEERRITRQRNADLIMMHIASLLPVEYKGFYKEGFLPNGSSQPDNA